MSTDLSPALLDILDQITDPTQAAVGELRDAIAELSREIRRLKKAVDSQGCDAKDWLLYLAHDVEEAAEGLARLAAGRRSP